MEKLTNDIEYIIIQNEETKEIIAKITKENIEAIRPYIVRVKYNNSKIKMFEKSGKMGTAEQNKSLQEVICRLQEIDKTKHIKSVEIEY